ncbi:MAG: insulinase family protein, partial [Bacteroidales bacterium]|nr:insulinase family protein [Bacteroidales bacterium]
EGRVQFRLAVNAGSVLEDEDQRGLAHFTEHMAFNGTEYFPHNELIDQLQKHGVQFGGHINAYTSFDETVYYVNMPNDADMVEMGFKILDGWASKLLMDPQELEDERGVIREEWRGNLGAQERMQKKYWPIMLKGSRYAERVPIGLESVIMGFQRPTIMRFYNDWYRPDLEAVIIVGDIDVNEIETKLKEYFNDNKMPVNPKARPEYNIPGNKEPLIAIATDKEASSAVVEMMWKHAKAPQGTVGDYRQSLVRNLADMMINARFSELNEKASAPFLAAAGGYGGFIGHETDAFSLYSVPKDNRMEECTALLLKEMKRVDEHGFLQTELDRAKEQLLETYRKSAKELNKTQSTQFADEYTRHFLNGEVIPGIRQEDAYAREFVPEITLEEVNNVVKDWITDENLVMIVMAPEREGYKVPTEQQFLDVINNNKATTTEPWVDTYKDEPLFTKEVADVMPRVTKQNSVLGYTEYTVPNGIRFVVKKTDYKEDQILMDCFSNGGSGLYNDEDAFMVSQVANMVDEAGIANFSSTQLQKKLQGKSVGISPNIASTTQGFNGQCAPKDLETMLQLLDLYYEAPRKDKESFDRNIESLHTQSRMATANPQVTFIKDFYNAIYPNYKRLTIVPTSEQIDGIDFDRVYQVYNERFHDASGMTFFFVGNIADADINLIAKYLNALPTDGTQKNEKRIDRSPSLVDGIKHSVTHAGIENQAMVIIVGEKKPFKGDLKERIGITALGEAVQITTLEIIREKMGDTYSPYGTVDYSSDFDGSVDWQFYMQCAPENTKQVEDAAIGVMKQYVKKGCDKATLDKVKQQLLKKRETNMQENSFWMNQIYSSYYFGEDRDSNITQYNDIVNGLTSKDIRNLAKKYLDLKHYSVGTMLPEEKN